MNSHKRIMAAMKRKTFHRLRSRSEPALHHHVYVVLLNPEVAKHSRIARLNPRRDPGKPCVYVGMTGLTPDERLLNHKRGFKSARIVHEHGIRLMPELYECFNPMPFEAAAQMEKELAEDLRIQGYTVAGGT